MSRRYIIIIIMLLIGGSICLLGLYLYRERQNKELQLTADNIDRLENLKNELEKKIENYYVRSFPKELSDSFPIRLSTTKITYEYHTNSGKARYSIYQIFRDSLVWNYNEARNHCHLKDLYKYKRADYETLIKKLSKLRFSGTCNLRETRDGGAGFNYNFEENSNCYLHYNDSYQLSGEYQEVNRLINFFIETHKTQCEILFEMYSNEPHEQAFFGEFKDLPPKLRKYVVN